MFAIADSAYREMMGGRESVSVVISGESGAGKTETTKLILNYISSLNSEPTAVEAKLIESATLLEAFGNAKTVRNNNSSRFGKLIKILFDGRSGLIAGKNWRVLFGVGKSGFVWGLMCERFVDLDLCFCD